MKYALMLLTSSCALLSLSVSPVFAADTPISLRSGADIPVLGPRVETPPRALITPTNADYSLMRVVLGVQSGIDYNSNIYRASSGEESDLIATLSPKLSAISRFDKHKLDLSISPEVGHYFSESKNDYIDWDARARGRYDATPTDALYFDARYRYDHVAIGSFEDDPSANLKDPVTYHRYELGAQWVGDADRIHYELGGAWDTQDFKNVRREDNTLNIQDDRDRDAYSVSGKLGYEVAPSLVVYTRGAYNDRRYDNRVDSSLLYTRDSNGYEAGVGVARSGAKSPLSFDIYLGYLNQDYDAEEMKDVDGLDVKADIKAQLSPKDVLELSVNREVKDTNTSGVSSNLQTRIGTELTHDCSETLKLGGLLAYTAGDYQSNMAIATLDREDDTYEAGINATYSPRDDIAIKTAYRFNKRDSNQPSAGYDAHIVGLSLAIKY